MKKIFFLFTRFILLAAPFLPFHLPATQHSTDDAIIVRLSTENRLIPLFLAKFSQANTSFDKKYLSKLEAIFDFDLSHNGMTQTIPHTKELDNLANSTTFDAPRNLEVWKARNIFYLVRVRVDNKTLSLQIVSVNNGVTHTSDSVTLTGDLSQDRQIIHQLADTFHCTLFRTNGIAGTRFLYTVKTRPKNCTDSYQWISEVWEADYDGGNARQVTHENTLCITPIYVPPKKGYSSSGTFLYVSYKTGQPKIYTASLIDCKGRRFSYLPGNQLMPSISLQRDKVSFISDVTSNPDVFLQPFSPDVGALGKPRQIFTARYATQGSPVFHPNGKKVAFVSNKDGPPRIYVMDIPPPGASTKQIKPAVVTKRNRENTAPSWSPDGSKIAYCAKTNGVRQIWIYDCITGEERQLTQGPGNKENPTWAPNSLHLIFNSASEDSSEIYLVNLNQPDAVKISSGAGEKRYPCWEPRISTSVQ